MVALKVKMKAVSATELVAGINCVEFPEIQWLFFEPDVSD